MEPSKHRPGRRPQRGRGRHLANPCRPGPLRAGFRRGMAPHLRASGARLRRSARRPAKERRPPPGPPPAPTAAPAPAIRGAPAPRAARRSHGDRRWHLEGPRPPRADVRRAGRRLMRFLFTTLQTYESDFYGLVGAELVRRGHKVSHLTVSRRAAKLLRAQGVDVRCVYDVIASLPAAETSAETARIETEYGLPTIRDAYRGDRPCEGKPEEWCVRRAVDYFRAVERVLDEAEPDALVPEVGSEGVRIAMHPVGVARRIPVLFLLLAVFPRPLRLYVDTLDAPIVD